MQLAVTYDVCWILRTFLCITTRLLMLPVNVSRPYPTPSTFTSDTCRYLHLSKWSSWTNICLSSVYGGIGGGTAPPSPWRDLFFFLCGVGRRFIREYVSGSLFLSIELHSSESESVRSSAPLPYFLPVRNVERILWIRPDGKASATEA